MDKKIGAKTHTHLIWIYSCLIFFKIRHSLTTSKEGLKTRNIHEQTTRISLQIVVVS